MTAELKPAIKPRMRKAAEPKPPMVSTYRAGRILDIGEGKRQPGELVPEAVTWFRLENLVNLGYLQSTEVSVETFAEAVQKYCPELTDQIGNLVHVDLEKAHDD